MSNKINDEIADKAVEMVNLLIEDKEICEEQRDMYLDEFYKSLMEKE